MATKLRRMRALLIDLSGTLHIGTEPLPGAARAVQKLRDNGIPFRFCSNSSKESTSSLVKKLREAGFTVQENEIFTSLGAMKKLLLSRGIKRPFLMLTPSAAEDFAEFSDTGHSSEADRPKYDAVVMGLAPEKFTYDTMNEAFRILSAGGNDETSRIPLLTTHRVRYIRTSSGDLSLGPGPFVTALEMAVGEGCVAESVGKPTRTFFDVCLRDLGIELDKAGNEQGEIKLDDVAIIGDDIEADLGGSAVELGLRRILVKTGKYRPGDERRSGVVPPDEVYDSFAAIVDELTA